MQRSVAAEASGGSAGFTQREILWEGHEWPVPILLGDLADLGEALGQVCGTCRQTSASWSSILEFLTPAANISPRGLAKSNSAENLIME